MLLALTMPQFGESINQARIVHWLKNEGDTVQEGEPLVEMETEKAVFSYESPFGGRLKKILEKDDVEVNVGKEIAQFEVSDEDGKKYQSLGVGQQLTSEKVEPKAEIKKEVKAEAKTEQKKEAKIETQVEEKEATKPALSPLIRSMAKEKGVSLEAVEKISGTGPGGRITKDDFLKVFGGGGATSPVQESVRKSMPLPAAEEPKQREGVTTLPISPIRARIADNMVRSKQVIPHAGTGLDVNFSLIATWREGKKDAPGYLVFVAWAVIQAIRSFPLMNSSWKEQEGKRWIEQYSRVHLGLAVATEQGLMVPVVRNADQRSFKDLAQEMNRVIDGARKGGLGPNDLTGATFTLNNTGSLGAIRSLQIIPYPQSAVLATNRVVKRPWVVGDQVEVRPVMSLDLAFDHRVIDGDLGIRFLNEVARILENFDFSRIS